ncbi:MAG: nuclear transport factor 2 family protein [Chloroflexi bacterium]|nr:nuclear transport factor 2 family protein [Chloroflexota bacterium]
MTTHTDARAVDPAIRRTLDAIVDAYLRGDFAAFIANYLPADTTTLVVQAPNPDPDKGPYNKVLIGIDAIREFYADADIFKPDFAHPRLSFDEVHVTDVAPDVVNLVAICSITSDDVRLPDGALVSLLLRNVDGRWLIMHDHTH